MGAADVFGLTHVALKQLQEPHHLSGEQFNVALGIQQLITGLLDFLRTGIRPQQALLFHFTEAQLRRAVGAEQTGMGCQRVVFTGFGVLHLVKQDGRQQHRVEAGAAALLLNDRLEGLQPRHRVVPQGGELIDPFREQACQGWLGAVDAKTALELLQFFGAKAGGIRVAAAVDAIDGHARARLQAGLNQRVGGQAGQGRRRCSKPRPEVAATAVPSKLLTVALEGSQKPY